MSQNIASSSWETYIPLSLIHLRLHQAPYYVQLQGLQRRMTLRDWSKPRGDHQGGQGAGAHNGK